MDISLNGHSNFFSSFWDLENFQTSEWVRGNVKRNKTNRPIVGLVSTDRSVVAALLSTTPRPVTKSSANDLAPLRCSG